MKDSNGERRRLHSEELHNLHKEDTKKYNYEISREKFKPEPGFEPQISRFLARRSTT